MAVLTQQLQNAQNFSHLLQTQDFGNQTSIESVSVELGTLV